MTDPGVPGLAGILETALCFDHSEREEMLEFYESTLGLRKVAGWGDGTSFRIGPGVLILFDREQLAENDSPVAQHGTDGVGHACLRSDPGRYEDWKERLADAGVEIIHEHEWPGNGGGRSFYFKDPAGNLVEIADRDIWPD